MKKKVLIIAVAVIAVIAIIGAVLALSGRNKVSINASYERAAKQLEAAGYTVTVVTDAEQLQSYAAEGLTAAVVAYKGAEKLEAPDEEKLDDYGMVELFYFETDAQAEEYYHTEGFQFGYQAWSDGYYHIGNSDFFYGHTANVAYAGLRDALDLCA